ncbi:hypothetical protein [Paenibacillus durus]|uniref:hypothetical protein n=1 Tax=Paenibacillus durus TaxID=44251 RepID=UPI0012E04BB4|nr:hypothetical protein [Paenibacillus durus]
MDDGTLLLALGSNEQQVLAKGIMKKYGIKEGSKNIIKGTGIAKIGDSFGKAGTLVKNPGTKIDWSKVSSHALERMKERGVTKKMAKSWLKMVSLFLRTMEVSTYFSQRKAQQLLPTMEHL